MPAPLSMADHVPPANPQKPMNPPAIPEKLPPDPLIPNGTSFQPPSLPRQNESSMRTSLQDLPPELRHWAEDYQPLGRLFTRATQEAFNTLQAHLSDVSKMPDQPQVNGAQPSPDTTVLTHASAQKRLKWLNFAHKQRHVFMKLLVISQWSKSMHDIEKLVDVNLWLNEQFEHYRLAEVELAELRRSMTDARYPSPDITTALEVLQTGGSTRTSHLNYIPLKPISAAETLKTLKNLDILLHIRLNLHEDLPEHFKQYSIGSGRVTFTVPHEFEVDLAIGDESPTSQFWFVDFRLSFSPVSDISEPGLLAELERHVNATLAKQGLSGCYNFLHELSLTHKVNILRQQALDLSRFSRAGSLNVEHMHRSLVVQYWADRPGRKNWIQVSAVKGKASSQAIDTESKPTSLHVKCVQNGKPTPENDFPVPLEDLNMEWILQRAMTQHATRILSYLETRFVALLSPKDPSSLEYAISGVSLNLAEGTLKLPLVMSQEATVIFDSRTGHFALQPPSPASERYQAMLNSPEDSVEDPFPLLERWRAVEMQSQMEMFATNSRFTAVSTPGLTTDTIRKAFGQDVVRASFFTHKLWAESDWYLCVSIHPVDQNWWVAQIVRHERGVSIVSKEPMMNLTEYYLSSQYPKLDPYDIERFAFAKITISVLSAKLHGEKIPCALDMRVPESSTDAALVKFSARALLAKQSTSVDGLAETNSVFATDTLMLVVRGFDNLHGDTEDTNTELSAPLVDYTARGFLDGTKVKPNLLTQLESPDLSVDSHGRFCLRLKARLGSADVIDRISARLHSLQRLSHLLIVLGTYGMTSQSVTESQVVFQYCTNPELSATVSFGSSNSSNLELSLRPTQNNPQQRILRFLINMLNETVNSSPGGAFEAFFKILALTQPVLRTLDDLEKADNTMARVRISAHNESTFLLTYPKAGRTFRVMLATKKAEPQWTIASTDMAAGANNAAQVTIDDRLKGLFATSGENWYGRKDGIIAQPDGVRAAIEAVDKVLKDCEALAKPTSSSKSSGKGAGAQSKRGGGAAQTANGQGGGGGGQKKDTGKAKAQAQAPAQAQTQPQHRGANGAAKSSAQSDVVVLDD